MNEGYKQKLGRMELRKTLTKEQIDEFMEAFKNQPLQYLRSDNQEEEEILQDAVDTFGMEDQLDMLIEEMAEVTQAICKWRRKRWTHMPENHPTLENLHEELADLSIVYDQMKYIFDDKKIKAYRAVKLARLKQRIEEHESNTY